MICFSDVFEWAFSDVIGGRQVWWVSINLQNNKVIVIGFFLLGMFPLGLQPMTLSRLSFTLSGTLFLMMSSSWFFATLIQLFMWCSLLKFKIPCQALFYLALLLVASPKLLWPRTPLSLQSSGTHLSVMAHNHPGRVQWPPIVTSCLFVHYPLLQLKFCWVDCLQELFKSLHHTNVATLMTHAIESSHRRQLFIVQL